VILSFWGENHVAACSTTLVLDTQEPAAFVQQNILTWRDMDN
jgi:hypothetical protein